MKGENGPITREPQGLNVSVRLSSKDLRKKEGNSNVCLDGDQKQIRTTKKSERKVKPSTPLGPNSECV